MNFGNNIHLLSKKNTTISTFIIIFVIEFVTLDSFGHNVDFELEISVGKASIYLNDGDTVVE
jgi:hypothetical protein